MIFKLFGPPELKNLVASIDEQMALPGSKGIVIYPAGEFNFSVKTSNEDDLEPMIFPTAQERASFQVGLSYGVSLMGGTTTGLNEEDFEALDKMEKKATHGSGGQRNN